MVRGTECRGYSRLRTPGRVRGGARARGNNLCDVRRGAAVDTRVLWSAVAAVAGRAWLAIIAA